MFAIVVDVAVAVALDAVVVDVLRIHKLTIFRKLTVQLCKHVFAVLLRLDCMGLH